MIEAAGDVQAHGMASYTSSHKKNPKLVETARLPTKQGALPRHDLSCGGTNHGTAKRHRDRRPHHVEQYANASGVIKPLDRANEIDERSGQDSHRLPDQ